MPSGGHVDVLIIGAGPAGLMCANALAMAGARIRVIDKRPVKVAAGQADAIQPRIIEVLQSYGLAERLIREGNQLHMNAFYSPSCDGGVEKRTGHRNLFNFAQIDARYPFAVTLHQGAIEAIFIDSMSDHGVEVERPRRPIDIEISEDVDELSNPSSYPVKVTVENLDTIDEENKTEVVYAKFVIGADGAHSWVRKYLGIEMEGEQTGNLTALVWGVVDIVPETNFPDIHKSTVIRSEHGTCRIIPRLSSNGRVDKSKMTPQKLLSVAKKIFHPFELADPKEIEWWTIYVIGQHVASSYSVKDRIFIAGDACHTHSPKAAQGMNASMNDTHNLAWKLAQVVRGWSDPSLLKTYEQERRKFAQDLIDFDKVWASLFTREARTAAENEDGVSQEEFLRASQTFAGFVSGIGVHYSPSAIVDLKYQQCAERLIIGQRMPPQIFVRAVDIRPVEIQDLLPSDVRFKVLFFVGNVTETRVAELKLLEEELSKPSRFLHKYSADGNISTVFEIITITAGKEDMNYLLVPALFRPHWTKVLLDDTDMTGSKGGHGYETFGVDAKQITVVVVRPDGYVGMIAPSAAIVDLDNYFSSFLLPRGLN